MARRRFRSTVWAPVLILLVYGLTLVVDLIPPGMLGALENPYLSAVVIQLLIYALPALFYCRLRGREFTPKLRLRVMRPSHLLYLFHALVLMTSVSVLVSVLMYRLAPGAFSESSSVRNASFAMGNGFFDGVYLIVAFALLPAMTEEFLYRGIIIGEYEEQSPAVAVAVSAVMFAMSHFSAVRFPVYLGAGLILGSVLYVTRSVLAPVLVHAGYNALMLWGEKNILFIVDKQNVSMVLLLILLGAAALTSAMLLSFEAQSIYRGYAEDNVPSDYKVSDRRSPFAHIAEAFFSPPFLILVLLFIIVAVARR